MLLKTKLLFVVNIDSFFVSHRLPIALKAIEEGLDVHLLTNSTSHGEQLEKLGIKVHHLKFPRRNIFSPLLLISFLKVLFVLKNVKPDIVHAVTILPILITGLSSIFFPKIRLCVSIAGLGSVFTSKGWFPWFRKIVVEVIFNIIYKCKRGNIKFIFQNTSDLKLFENKIGITHNDLIMTKGSGVDLEKYKFSELPCDPPVILFAARLIREKGVLDFVEAARLTKAVLPEVRFVLIGESDPGNPYFISPELISTWESGDILEYWGGFDSLKNILSKALVFVYPSHYGEGVPKVLLEVASSGRPIITTDHPGCRDAIIAGVTGLLVPIKAPETLSKAIISLVKDRARCKKMSVASRKYAVKEFGVDKVVSSHLQLYSDLLAGKN